MTGQFSLLVKPASADCNLRCEYCFYLGHSTFYPETSRHRMSDETLEKVISGYMATEQPQYAFGWQGGEPTLMGAEFFRKVTALQSRYGRRGAVVANGLQTNATLIDDEMAAHFAEYKFLLGVSLDGPPEVHDLHRKNASGRPSHADVMRGIRRLQKAGVEFNILVLVSDANVRRGREVYRYLRDSGYSHHQYIPCVEFDPEGRPLPFAVGGERWGEFLCAVYDEWLGRDEHKVSVRLFDSVLWKMVEGGSNICHMGKDCRQYFVVEYNGDVYPCDFFVEKGLRLGNVAVDTWEAMGGSEVYRAFGRRKAQWNQACDSCEWVELCAGDCLKHRFRAGADLRRLSALCAGWKLFYSHAMPGFRRLAAEIVRERRLPPNMPPARESPSRNAPCPCGSGRKFKVCCGRNRPGGRETQ